MRTIERDRTDTERCPGDRHPPSRRRPLLLLLLLTLVAVDPAARAAEPERPNFVFVLTDDQRFDAFSFMEHPFLETPSLDRLAAEGVVFDNAFVTTSLCSPSRATILTGLHAHRHGVLANRTRLDPAIPTFARLLQESGYDTAFVGKWHMGAPDDSPRPGWSHWVSFPGQGAYVGQRLNVDGEYVETDGYITDVLTDHAVRFLERERDRPFFLYLSHKAVHSPFVAADRHRGSYAAERYPHPDTMADTEETYRGKPEWVRAQRDSWHGVDGMYDRRVDFETFVRDYAETLRAVDDSVGRLIETLRASGELDSTIFVFSSDNGFQFGEHGLIDKRTFYEASIRVPLIVRAPFLGAGGRHLSEMVLNLDLAPTFLDLAGVEIPASMQGRSFAPLLRGEEVEWRDAFLYAYFWERDFPQTPTVFGIRTDRYKLMRYHGIWDRHELYDLERDPQERHNLIGDFATTTQGGNVEYRILGSPSLELLPVLGRGADDAELKELFGELWQRLETLIEESGANTTPDWEAER